MGPNSAERRPGGLKGPPNKRKGPVGPPGPGKAPQVQHKIQKKRPDDGDSPRGPPSGRKDFSKGKQERPYKPRDNKDSKHRPQHSSSNSNSSGNHSNSNDNSNSSPGKVPQWAIAAVKAGEEAKAKAAAAAAARASLPPVPHLSLAHVADATQQQHHQQQQQQQKRKKVPGERGLSGISGIESLDIQGRGVRTAEDLSALKHLKRIDISDNHLDSLSFLSLNLSLGHLKAAKNQIVALGNALENLSNLRVLDLSDNQVPTHPRTGAFKRAPKVPSSRPVWGP